MGIESTAHTFGVGIAASDGSILANEAATYRPSSGGIHPREAAQHHALVAHRCLRDALREAGIEPGDIGVFSFSVGPGMGPCLRTGATIARALALRYGKPLVAVNHGVAHIEIGRLTTGSRDPVVLYVAGGNTLITTHHVDRYRVLGETLDIAAGNCLDSLGIYAGVGPMPAPEIEAARGRTIHPLPMKVKGMDVSFTGLLTAAKRLMGEGVPVSDICLSATEAVYSMLTEVLERALALMMKKEVVIVGGLARSRRLRGMVDGMAQLHGARHLYVPDEYLGDNGAMIAWTGLLMHRHGMHIEVEESHVRPKMRIDDVPTPWLSERDA